MAQGLYLYVYLTLDITVWCLDNSNLLYFLREYTPK